MKIAHLLAALSIIVCQAKSPNYLIESQPWRYTVYRGGNIGMHSGSITFIGGASDMELKQAAFAILSTRSRPASALVNQKLDLFDMASNVKVGEVFFLNENADRGIGVFSPPQLLKKGSRRTFTLYGDSVQQNANNWEQRGIDLTLAYDGSRTGIEGNYAVDVETGENIPGPSGGFFVFGESRIFRNVPEFRVVESATSAFAGIHSLTIGVRNPDPTRDLAFKKLTYRVKMTRVKDARFVVYGSGERANFTPVAAKNGIVEVLFDSGASAKIVLAGSEKKYALVPETIVYDENIPSGFQYILAEILPDTGVPEAGVMGTVLQIENGRENQNNIIWSPFTKNTPGATLENESEPDWTNSYGLPGLPFVASWNVPQLAGITVIRNEATGLPQFVKLFVRGAGDFIPPYRIEVSTDLVNWGEPDNALGGSGGATSSGYWASTYDYQATQGGRQFFRLINE